MNTTISFKDAQVTIGDEHPTVLIGERINPTGKKKLAAAMEAGDFDPVKKEALLQVEAGADVLDVNVGVPGVDEATLLSRVVSAISEVVHVPLCLDSRNPLALYAALEIYEGKPLINSVTGEDRVLEEILPIVKSFGTAVVGLLMDDEGIHQDVEGRVAIGRKIVDRAEKMGIPRNDIIIDCLAMTIGSDDNAGKLTLNTIRQIKRELGVNITLGVSNISFGLPDRDLINHSFLALCIAAGVNCPVVDVSKTRPGVLATDLILGRDTYASRYIKAYRRKPADPKA